MTKTRINSLSTRIVFSIMLVSLFSIFAIFAIFEKMNREAFYNVEMEKANIIAKTIEPLIALNIYLDMTNNIDGISRQLLENENILSVMILKKNIIINEMRSKEYPYLINESFVVEHTLFEPNSNVNIGTLIITYSNKKYLELIEKYTTLLVVMLLTFSVLFILFSLYVKKLLSPLRRIAKSLKNYTPDKTSHLPIIEENNEIGLISNALNKMQNNILKYSKQQQDINETLEEKVNEKTLELREQLYTDSLTGLQNRHELLEEITDIKDGALLIINIDDFKEINDFFGHTAGDDVLKYFSNRLSNMFFLDKNIKLNRLAGDEFTLLFKQKPSLEEFINISDKLLHDVEKMVFFYETNELAINVTIGGAYQTDGALLEKADIALKLAKKQQKSFLLYNEALHVEEEYKENMNWVKELKKAIEEDRIVPYFQPIYDNYTNKIASYECLVRLIDSDDNIISPYKFLTIAKKSRLYSKLTKIMVRKSCQYFENIDCDFSINISVEDMLDRDTVDYIKEKVQKHNVSNKIILEVLESEGIENYEEVSLFVDEMKKLGCRIAVDDFGSGYSNFEHIIQLNVDFIKLDGSIIKNLDKDLNAQVVVETIVNFAKKLNILTVAEFVHNKEVNAKVKELNIERSQGFYLSEPQSQAKEFNL